MAPDTDGRAPYLGRRWLAALGLAAMAFVVAIFGSLQYSGLINQMGEWQFAKLGFYLPMISVLAWVGLVGLLLWLAAKIALRRKADEVVAPALLRQHGTFFRNCLIILGFLAGLVALAGAVNLLLLPSGSGREQMVTPPTFNAGLSGNARLQGFRVAGPMARYSEGVLIWKRDIYLVPLGSGTPAAGAPPVRLFAQVTPYEAASKVPVNVRGILRQGALPRELYPLYAGQGVTIEDGAAVLYRDSFSMALSTLLLIGEAALVAVLAFVVAGIVHRRRRRILSNPA